MTNTEPTMTTPELTGIERATLAVGNAGTLGGTAMTFVCQNWAQIAGVLFAAFGAWMTYRVTKARERRDELAGKTEHFRLIHEAVKLCNDCKRLGMQPTRCPVAQTERPVDCPLKNQP